MTSNGSQQQDMMVTMITASSERLLKSLFKRGIWETLRKTGWQKSLPRSTTSKMFSNVNSSTQLNVYVKKKKKKLQLGNNCFVVEIGA